ncbi:MAG: hypothetical protein INH37_15070 [Myxococcaceae bacterium]|nr:hypothetical protein [Myxococcaceae bacterium]
MPVASSARCPAHAAVQAVEVCERCGRFVCAECLTFAQDGAALCPGCFALPRGRSSRSGLALGLVLVGWSGCLPLTPVGMAMAWTELKAIERGESAEASKPGAQWALGLGALQLVGGVLIVAGVVGWTMLRASS